MTLSEIVQSFGPMLLQTSIVLAVAAIIAMPLLRNCRRPWVHQLVWGGVLLLGLVGMRIPVALPVVEPVAMSTEIVAVPENPVPKVYVTPKDAYPVVSAEPFAFEPPPFVAAIAHEPPIIESTIIESTIIEPETLKEPETSVSGSPREQRPASHPEADASGSLAALLFALWGGVVFVQLFRHFVRYFLLLRMLRHAEPGDEQTLALWTEILDRAGVGKRRPKLAMLPDVGPAMIRTPTGYTLLLSKSHWTELDTELQRGVMRHELAHFLNGDLRKTLFARLVVLLHWFNPLAHLAARRFEEAIEWSADSFSYGSEKNGLEQFAAAMLSLHETTPQNYRYRVAFGAKDILRRLEFLKRLKTGAKESPWKTGLVLGLSLILFILGTVNIRIVAQEKKSDNIDHQVKFRTAPDSQTSLEPQLLNCASLRTKVAPFIFYLKHNNIAAQDTDVRPLSKRVADLVEQIEKENLKDEKLREKIGGDTNDEFLQSIAEEMLRLKRSHAAVEVVMLMRDTVKKDTTLLSIAQRQLFAAFRKPQADTSMFHKSLSTASLISDETVRDNMRSLVLLHYTKCVGFEKMNQPNRFERDKNLAFLLAKRIIHCPVKMSDEGDGIWNIPGRQGTYVVNQYGEQTPEPTPPGFTNKEKSELIDKIVRKLDDPLDRGRIHEYYAFWIDMIIDPDWDAEQKNAAEEDARWRLTEAKVEYRKSDKHEAKKRLEKIDKLFDKVKRTRTESDSGKDIKDPLALPEKWTVVVRDETGDPMPGVKLRLNIHVDGIGIRNIDKETGVDGVAVYDFSEFAGKSFSTFRFWLDKPGYTPIFSNYDRREPPFKPVPSKFEAVMRKGVTISGRVVDETGQLVEGVTVHVELAGNKDDKLIGENMVFSPWLGNPKTDKDGRWSCDTVPPNGKIKLGFEHPHFIKIDRLQAIEFPLKDLREGTREYVLRRGFTVNGAVTDPEGKPVAGATVYLCDLTNEYLQFVSDENKKRTSSDENGRYAIKGWSPVPTGLLVFADGFAPEFRVLKFSDGPAIENVALSRGKTLRLRAVDSSGNPVEGIRFQPMNWRGYARLFEAIKTVPKQTGRDGIWQWNHAPDDTVAYVVIDNENWYTEKPSFVLETTSDEKTEAHSVLFHRSPKFSGRVIDASTKRPIERLLFIPGQIFDGDISHEKINWDTWEPKSEHCPEGRYSYTLRPKIRDQKPSHFVLRIEAEGYQPAISKIVAWGGESEIPLDAQLEPKEQIELQVLTPSGRPAPGVRYFLFDDPRRPFAFLNNVKVDSIASGATPLQPKADAEGRFRFPSKPGLGIVLMHNDGARTVAVDQLGLMKQEGSPSRAMTVLQPWGRVQGKVMKGDKPWAGVEVVGALRLSEDDECRSVRIDYSVKADQDGRFVFEKVFPQGTSKFHWQEFQLHGSARHMVDGGAVALGKPGRHG